VSVFSGVKPDRPLKNWIRPPTKKNKNKKGYRPFKAEAVSFFPLFPQARRRSNLLAPSSPSARNSKPFGRPFLPACPLQKG
jgi:hypothetical protein